MSQEASKTCEEGVFDYCNYGYDKTKYSSREDCLNKKGAECKKTNTGMNTYVLLQDYSKRGVCPSCVAGSSCPPCSKDVKLKKGDIIVGEFLPNRSEKFIIGGSEGNVKGYVNDGGKAVVVPSKYLKLIEENSLATKPFFTTQTLLVMGVLGLVGVFVAYKLLK